MLADLQLTPAAVLLLRELLREGQTGDMVRHPNRLPMPKSAPSVRPRQSRADGPHPFLRGKTWWARIPSKRPPAPQRSLGTPNRARAKAICGMLRSLAHLQRWDLLAGIADGTHELDQVFASWSAGRLAAYEAEHRAAANDPDLEPLVQPWHDHLAGEGHKTVGRYLEQLRTLIPEGAPFRRSQLTKAAVRAWLDSKKPRVRNRYRSAASMFVKHLIEHDIMQSNPVLMVTRAKVPDPRTRHLSPDEGIAVLDKLEGEMRALHALIIASGADVVSACLALRRHVDQAERSVFIDGTKYRTRSRTCYLLHDWAADVFLDYVKTRPADPNARLFTIYDDSKPRAAYEASRAVLLALRAALRACQIVDYTTRDHRHTHAVNALKLGYSYAAVAHNLGHANTALVHSTYGKFVPNKAEFTRRVAFELHATASGATPTGTPGDPPSDSAAAALPQAAPG